MYPGRYIPEFRTITLCPVISQLMTEEPLTAVLCLVALVTGGWEGIPLRWLFLVTALLLALYLAYKALYLKMTRYIVTSEQLIYRHGVIVRSTDYMELYRVIDYRQDQTLLQQIGRIKNITIYSGDRNTPVMVLKGICQEEDVIAMIRERVEFNRQTKHIYEVSNRI